MKIQFMSDLHLEWMTTKTRSDFIRSLPVTGDVLVLAGDIVTYNCFVECTTMFAEKWPHVLHVPGNHEYYGSNKGTINRNADKVMRRCPNYHFLNEKVVEIDGVKFIGTTLWFPETPMNFMNRSMMTDYRVIQGFKHGVFDWNRTSVQFLKDNMTEGCVTVLHHAPSFASVNPRYKDDKHNSLYVCPIEPLIMERKPKVVFHGHMHDAVFYEIDKTSVRSNPRGYEDPDGIHTEASIANFVPELIFEV